MNELLFWFAIALVGLVGIIVVPYLVVVIGKRLASRSVSLTVNPAGPLAPPVTPVAPAATPAVVAPTPLVVSPPIVPAAPVTTRAGWNWTWVTTPAHYATAPFRNWKLDVVLVLIALVGVAFWKGLIAFSPGSVRTSVTFDEFLASVMALKIFGLPVVAILIVVAVIALLYRLIRPVQVMQPASVSWSFGSSEAWIRLLAHLMVFICLEYAIYSYFPNSTLFSGPGLWHIPVYLFFIFTVFVVESLKGGKGWARFALFVAFIFLGMAHLPPGWFSSWGNSWRQTATLTTQTTPACDGRLSVHPYNAGVTYRVNSPTCQLRAYVMSGCVTWLDIAERPLGKTCNGPVSGIAPGIQLMRVDSTAVVRLNHCQNYARGIMVDECI